MKFLATLALAAALAAAVPQYKRAPSPLEVNLEASGNSAVKATITNTGQKDLRVLKIGTFLDDAPVEKAQVFTGEQSVEFDGIRIHVSGGAMEDDDFELIPAGSTIEKTFDVAELHDLSIGGVFSIHSIGALSYADADSNELIGSVFYDSNILDIDVNGDEAATARVEFHAKRTRVQNSCTGTQLNITKNALNRCATLARTAQKAALSGPANKMNEFYKSSSTATRNVVGSTFSRIANECSSINSGVSTYYCSDPYGACRGSVLAYTVPSMSVMAYCPIFFKMAAAANSCYGQDQGNTVLHEATHLRQIKGTDDYGGYGYKYVRGLSAAQNLNHADTYTLFAQAVSRGC